MTHTRVIIEGVDYECAMRDCGHDEDYCPVTPNDACDECSTRSWNEHEGPVILWSECEGVGAFWALLAAEDSDDPCPEWNCPDLSTEDRREGRTCPEHPCTCSSTWEPSE